MRIPVRVSASTTVALSSFLSYKDISVRDPSPRPAAALPRAMRGHPRPIVPCPCLVVVVPCPCLIVVPCPCLVTFSDFHCLDTAVSSLDPTDRPSARLPYRASVTQPLCPHVGRGSIPAGGWGGWVPGRSPQVKLCTRGHAGGQRCRPRAPPLRWRPARYAARPSDLASASGHGAAMGTPSSRPGVRVRAAQCHSSGALG